MKGSYKAKRYYDNGRTLDWGKDLSPAEITALEDGEIFTLLSEDGKLFSAVLKDSYGRIREQKI